MIKVEEMLDKIRPKGRWIIGIADNDITTVLFCTECGYENVGCKEFNFCPNCGADMRGDTNADSN